MKRPEVGLAVILTSAAGAASRFSLFEGDVLAAAKTSGNTLEATVSKLKALNR